MHTYGTILLLPRLHLAKKVQIALVEGKLLLGLPLFRQVDLAATETTDPRRRRNLLTTIGTSLQIWYVRLVPLLGFWRRLRCRGIVDVSHPPRGSVPPVELELELELTRFR